VLCVVLSCYSEVTNSNNCSAKSLTRRAFARPNLNKYPRSSLHDFSGLLDAPAGKHGFLSRRGEHFVWANGQRARFWGINVANTSLQESDADITRMVQNFRSAGFNLIRLHHIDERGGVIDLDKPNSRQLVAARLRKLDWWIHQAKKSGIYIYLSLLDYRRFKEGDGVVNAEAIGRARALTRSSTAS
jgi:hypothetical protein